MNSTDESDAILGEVSNLLQKHAFGAVAVSFIVSTLLALTLRSSLAFQPLVSWWAFMQVTILLRGAILFHAR